MSRKADAAGPLPRITVPPWMVFMAAMAAALASALLLGQLLMSPSAPELRSLAGYLTVSGLATVALGWIALHWVDRLVGLTLRARMFLGAVIGGAVTLLNVVIVAQLMFVSTAHDLPVLLALAAFSAVVTIFFSSRVAESIAGRLEHVASAIRSLAAGDYGARVDVGGADEVARLASDLNGLAHRLEIAERERGMLDRERRDLTAAISHDLRTPLASVRAMVEALHDGVVEDPAEVGRYYTTLRREIERLSRMIDDLFELARLDAGALRLDLRPVSLLEVAAEVVDAMQARARQCGVTLQLESGSALEELSLDGTRIERAVSNLVRNAVEHTPAGGRVDVLVSESERGVTLCVSDTGEGIETGDLPKIWERFYRGEKSRHRTGDGGDGAGLGLAIVRGVVEAHGGEVRVSSVVGRGAAFEMTLPRDGRLVEAARLR